MGYNCPKCGSFLCEMNQTPPQICPHCRYDMLNQKMPGENGYNGNWNYDQPNNNNQPSYSSGGGIDWSEITWNKVLAPLIALGGSGLWLWFLNLDGVSEWVTDLPDFFWILISFGPIALCIFFGFKIGLKDK